MERGLVHLYYGDGKGKTTAAAGLGLRAWGRGKTVLMVQFLKGFDSGEILALGRLGGRCRLSPERHCSAAPKNMRRCSSAVRSLSRADMLPVNFFTGVPGNSRQRPPSRPSARISPESNPFRNWTDRKSVV